MADEARRWPRQSLGLFFVQYYETLVRSNRNDDAFKLAVGLLEDDPSLVTDYLFRYCKLLTEASDYQEMPRIFFSRWKSVTGFDFDHTSRRSIEDLHQMMAEILVDSSDAGNVGAKRLLSISEQFLGNEFRSLARIFLSKDYRGTPLSSADRRLLKRLTK